MQQVISFGPFDDKTEPGASPGIDPQTRCLRALNNWIAKAGNPWIIQDFKVSMEPTGYRVFVLVTSVKLAPESAD